MAAKLRSIPAGPRSTEKPSNQNLATRNLGRRSGDLHDALDDAAANTFVEADTDLAHDPRDS